MRYFMAATLLCLGATPALANDSEAEVALGGLALKKSDAITMDSEDLFISRDLVRVAYRFTNTSSAPVETIVAFPLPDIPPQDHSNVSYWQDTKDLKFETTVDGTPIALETLEQAFLKERDVTDRLKVVGAPVNHAASGFDDAINRLRKEDRDKLVADGLLLNDGTEQEPFWTARWTVRTTITRRQTIPAQATVAVAHQYVPRAGGSVGGGLDPAQRTDPAFNETRAKYCIDDEFLRSLDRATRKRKKSEALAYSEVWLGYVLKTGANWKAPIREFRLVVDKGKADSLVSFCAEGVKKISPTRFESRRNDYSPTDDLNILIVDFPR